MKGNKGKKMEERVKVEKKKMTRKGRREEEKLRQSSSEEGKRGRMRR